MFDTNRFNRSLHHQTSPLLSAKVGSAQDSIAEVHRIPIHLGRPAHVLLSSSAKSTSYMLTRFLKSHDCLPFSPSLLRKSNAILHKFVLEHRTCTLTEIKRVDELQNSLCNQWLCLFIYV